MTIPIASISVVWLQAEWRNTGRGASVRYQAFDAGGKRMHGWGGRVSWLESRGLYNAVVIPFMDDLLAKAEQVVRLVDEYYADQVIHVTEVHLTKADTGVGVAVFRYYDDDAPPAGTYPGSFLLEHDGEGVFRLNNDQPVANPGVWVTQINAWLVRAAELMLTIRKGG